VLQVVCVPVICVYRGFGYSRWQHVAVHQPVDHPTSAPEFPRSWRFGGQAMDCDDAIDVRKSYSARRGETYSMVVLSLASLRGAILRSPKTRRSRGPGVDHISDRA
jgi:hypothetical protein